MTVIETVDLLNTQIKEIVERFKEKQGFKSITADDFYLNSHLNCDGIFINFNDMVYDLVKDIPKGEIVRYTLMNESNWYREWCELSEADKIKYIKEENDIIIEAINNPRPTNEALLKAKGNYDKYNTISKVTEIAYNQLKKGDEKGISKYGKLLDDNLEDNMLTHAIEETCDKLKYLIHHRESIKNMALSNMTDKEFRDKMIKIYADK